MNARTQAVEVTGRMWGYTDEIDWVERTVQRALTGKSATFVVTDRKVVGSRGLFAKRLVSKYEYTIGGPTRRDVQRVANLVSDLVGRIS